MVEREGEGRGLKNAYKCQATFKQLKRTLQVGRTLERADWIISQIRHSTLNLLPPRFGYYSLLPPNEL